MKGSWLVAVCAWGLLGGITVGAVQAGDGIQTRQVQFKKGESATTIKGAIQGRDTLDYQLIANQDQQMRVVLTGKSSTYFNILPPGSGGEAIFIGSSEGNTFDALLPAKGRYTIRVYQMGAAEQSKAKNAFTLAVDIKGSLP